MYHHIRKNIESARNLYQIFGCQISTDQDISWELKRLKKLIQDTQKAFLSTGISAACKKCGENGQHCCRAGTENKCDDILLLINLLLNNPLYYQPMGPTACGFLGEKGCTLLARPVICLNYLCQAIQEKIEQKRLIAVQQAIGRELDLQFILCEKIKVKIKELGGCPRIMSVTKKSENETKFSQSLRRIAGLFDENLRKFGPFLTLLQ